MFADMLITFLAIEKYYAFFIAVFKLNMLAYALDSIIGINYLTGYRLNNLFWICIIQIFAIVFNFIVSKYLSFKWWQNIRGWETVSKQKMLEITLLKTLISSVFFYSTEIMTKLWR